MSLSELAISELQEAGWTPDRRIDTAAYERKLLSEGYPVFPVVREFLSRFGGLLIPYDTGKPHVEGEERIYFWLCLDPFDLHTSPSNVQDCAERIGAPLCLIGEFDEGYAFLMMGEAGHVYARYEEYLAKLGNSGEEAIDSIINSNYGTKID